MKPLFCSVFLLSFASSVVCADISVSPTGRSSVVSNASLVSVEIFPSMTNSTAGLPGGCVDELYRLRAGDKISYQVLEDREPSKILVVADSGELELPCLGRVPAAGKTCKELAAEVTRALERDYYYKASVILALEQANRSLGRVYVWGQVRNQGAVELLTSEQLTAGKAILRAGGFSDFANRKRVKIIRSGPERNSRVLEVNMTEVLEDGKTEQDVLLHPDDAVVVGSRVIRF